MRHSLNLLGTLTKTGSLIVFGAHTLAGSLDPLGTLIVAGYFAEGQ